MNRHFLQIKIIFDIVKTIVYLIIIVFISLEMSDYLEIKEFLLKCDSVISVNNK